MLIFSSIIQLKFGNNILHITFHIIMYIEYGFHAAVQFCSGIDQRWYQNMLRTKKVAHNPLSRLYSALLENTHFHLLLLKRSSLTLLQIKFVTNLKGHRLLWSLYTIKLLVFFLAYFFLYFVNYATLSYSLLSTV